MKLNLLYEACVSTFFNDTQISGLVAYLAKKLIQYVIKKNNKHLPTCIYMSIYLFISVRASVRVCVSVTVSVLRGEFGFCGHVDMM